VKNLKDILALNTSAYEYADSYLNYLAHIFHTVDRRQVASFIDTLCYARNQGSTVFFIGNGGSASTASHFAADLGLGTRSWEKPFRAVSLCDNQAVLTALANDYSYDQVFSLQVQNRLKSGDVLVAISASGNSKNIIEAVKMAHILGGISVGLTGFDGGELKRMARVSVHVPTAAGEFGPVEDAHLVLNHLCCSFIARLVAGESQTASPQAGGSVRRLG